MEEPRRIRWFVITILLLAFALRVYRLDQQSIWYDEGLSIYYAQQDLPQLLEGTSATDHPPLYFVLLHGWLQVAGPAEFAVRFFSAIWGLLLIPLTYALGRRLLGWRSGAAAALILALSPFHVWYAQEVRMYTLVVVLNTAASLALLDAWRRPGYRPWLGYVLLTVAGLYAHFYTVFILAFHATFAAWSAWREGQWRPVITTGMAQGLAAVIFLPWGGFVAEQIRTNDTYWRGTLALGRAVFWLLREFAVGETYVVRWATLGAVTYGLLAAAGVVMAVARARWLGQRRSTSTTSMGEAMSAAAFVSFYVIIPVACLLAVSYSRPKFAPRYLISVTPAYYLLVGYALVALLRGQVGLHRTVGCLALRASGVACLALIVAVSGLSLWTHYTDTTYAKPDFRAVGRYIAKHAADRDAVVIVAGHSLPAFTYYNERGLAVYPLPARLLPTVTRPVDRRLVTETLNRALAEGHRRFWLVLWQEELADPVHLTLHYLERHGRRLGVLEAFHDVSLLLFDIPLGTTFPLEPPIPHPLGVSFDGQLELLGYDLDRRRVRPGDTIWLTLYWRALRPLTENYTAFTHLVGPEERMLGQKDRQLGGDYYPSSRWPVGEVFEEVYPIVVRDDAPPGRHLLWVGLYLRRTMERLPFVGQDGRPETRLLVADIEIEREALTTP